VTATNRLQLDDAVSALRLPFDYPSTTLRLPFDFAQGKRSGQALRDREVEGQGKRSGTTA